MVFGLKNGKNWVCFFKKRYKFRHGFSRIITKYLAIPIKVIGTLTSKLVSAEKLEYRVSLFMVF